MTRPPSSPPAAPPRHRLLAALAALLVGLPVLVLVAALSPIRATTASALPFTPPRPAIPTPPTAPAAPAPSAPPCSGTPGTPNPPGPAPGPRATADGGRGVVHSPPTVAHRPELEACAAVQRVAGGALGRKRPPEALIVWRRSRALGKPSHGRLVRGVQLPAFGTHFVTVDPVSGTSPNLAWRRYGTDRLVRVLLEVAGAYAAAHPDAPRLVVGDLSRPRGGRFGREFGGDGHRSHQNGLDVDAFYPRRDGRERIPARVGQVDRRLAQDLVDRFVRAGARHVFVGPRTRLHGPSKVVMTLANHDDHLHLRIRPGPRR
ncbi:MAG: penicillin-insensitive murein endopeptidase [Actinomycetes bacterium]